MLSPTAVGTLAVRIQSRAASVRYGGVVVCAVSMRFVCPTTQPGQRSRLLRLGSRIQLMESCTSARWIASLGREGRSLPVVGLLYKLEGVWPLYPSSSCSTASSLSSYHIAPLFFQLSSTCSLRLSSVWLHFLALLP